MRIRPVSTIFVSSNNNFKNGMASVRLTALKIAKRILKNTLATRYPL
jgi:hypothetical protein